MFSLSTSWNSSKQPHAIDMIREIRAIGFEYIELGFSLPIGWVDDALALKAQGLIKISSLHNMCPLPPGIGPKKASPDYYSLSSDDEKERALAIEAVKNTIAYARRAGAAAVVIHTGSVPIKDRTGSLVSAYGNDAIYERIKNSIIKERSAQRDTYIDNVIRNLKELVPIAKGAGVKLCIENRYSYRDIPLPDEFDMIFRAVKDVWYWHDVGHAEVLERLGFIRHTDFLDKFSGRLIGIHLHDIIGLLEDHKAPLGGTFNFEKIVPYIKNSTIKVIEAHQPATADDIRRGLVYLEKLFCAMRGTT